MLEAFLEPLAIALFIMTFVFFLAQVLEDNSIADIAWGLVFIIVALYTLFTNGNFHQRQVLITLLVLIWGFRLFVHILSRNRGGKETFKYALYRKRWIRNFHAKSYIYIYVFQAILIIVISVPVILVNNHYETELNWVDHAGLLLWSFGFLVEVLADYQLHLFKKIRGKEKRFMTEGLWKYSRHPNYFGEMVMWWGLFLIAFSTPYGWYAIISPITVIVLILFISGIPLLERKYSKNAEYKEYAAKTSIFIPWFSKK